MCISLKVLSGYHILEGFCEAVLYLTHFSPVLLFYTPWKHQKTFSFSIPPENIRKPLGFLMFSGGIEKQHRAVMG